MQQNELRAVVLEATERERWNAFVANASHFPLMQTCAWGDFKEASGWQVVRVGVENAGQLVAGIQVLIRSLPLRLASIAYVPRGPILDWQNKTAATLLFDKVHAVARQNRAIMLKLEPPMQRTLKTEEMLNAYGFVASSQSNQPPCTMLIDLTLDTDALMANMQKHTRYNVRYSARKGVEIREGNEADLPTAYRLLQCTSERAGFPIRSFDYYSQEWRALAKQDLVKLFLAYYEGEIIAFRMPAAFGGKAATLHSGSLQPYLNLKPNELLMWTCIEWAKDRGCTSYDVWGITEEVGELTLQGKPIPGDQKGGLWGVYYFKRGFGGEVVYYVGAYDFIYSPLLYKLMGMVMTRLGSLDNLARLGD